MDSATIAAKPKTNDRRGILMAAPPSATENNRLRARHARKSYRDRSPIRLAPISLSYVAPGNNHTLHISRNLSSLRHGNFGETHEKSAPWLSTCPRHSPVMYGLTWAWERRPLQQGRFF
jgi:hypothetical protein